METFQKPISIVAPVSEAIQKTKILLFKPFDLEKWFVIGFCAWLASFFRYRFSPNFGFNDHEASQEWTKIIEFIKENIVIIAAFGSIAVVLVLAVVIVMLWLNCRGHFMFVDCLAKNKAQVIEPWQKYKEPANSLFWFRIILGILNTFAVGIFIVPLVFLITVFNSDKILLVPFVVFVSLAGLFIIGAALFFGIVHVLTLDFVVPIMYLNKIRVMQGWHLYLPILKSKFFLIILYLIFKFLISIAVGFLKLLVLVIGCCTCCLWVLLFIPYLGTVIYLPFISFMRLYPLCFLRQFGSEYDVFINSN